MEQPRGYMSDSLTRAAYVLAMRAVRAGLVSALDIGGRLQTEGFAYVPDRTVRWWVSDNPDLPEQVIDAGLAQPEDFPMWTRGFLRTEGGGAHMAQDPAFAEVEWSPVRNYRLEAEVTRMLQEMGLIAPSRPQISLGGVVRVLAAGFVGYHVLKALNNSTNSR